MKKYFDSVIEFDVDFYVNEKHMCNINTGVDVELEEWSDPGSYYQPSEYEITIINESDIVKEILDNLEFSDDVKKIFKQIIEYIIWDLLSELEIDSPEDIFSINKEISIEDYLETGKF